MGKKAILPHIRPITVWDVVCLLWTYQINRLSKTNFLIQTAYLMKMFKLLTDEIKEMEESVLARSTSVNLTFSVQKGRILRYFFGASIRYGTAEVRQTESRHIK